MKQAMNDDGIIKLQDELKPKIEQFQKDCRKAIIAAGKIELNYIQAEAIEQCVIGIHRTTKHIWLKYDAVGWRTDHGADTGTLGGGSQSKNNLVITAIRWPWEP